MLNDIRQVKYLCFSGSGVDGCMYCGALMALANHINYDQFSSQIEGCAGTSSGALAALCFIVGLSPQNMNKIIERWSGINAAPKMDMAMFIESYGLDDGDTVKKMMGNVLTDAGISTEINFADLKRLTKKRFVCCSTNLTKQCPEYFEADTTPDMKVVDGLYMSMCLPFVFKPVIMNGCYYTDGGLTDNYPCKIFPAEETLLMTVINLRSFDIHSWKDYIYTIVSSSLSYQKTMLKERQIKIRLDLDPPPKKCICSQITVVSSTLVVRGYLAMISRLYPAINIITETILYFIILHHVMFLGTKEEHLLYNEVSGLCEKQGPEESQ